MNSQMVHSAILVFAILMIMIPVFRSLNKSADRHEERLRLMSEQEQARIRQCGGWLKEDGKWNHYNVWGKIDYRGRVEGEEPPESVVRHLDAKVRRYRKEARGTVQQGQTSP